jgi:hypothetical protein
MPKIPSPFVYLHHQQFATSCTFGLAGLALLLVRLIHRFFNVAHTLLHFSFDLLCKALSLFGIAASNLDDLLMHFTGHAWLSLQLDHGSWGYSDSG